VDSSVCNFFPIRDDTGDVPSSGTAGTIPSEQGQHDRGFQSEFLV